MWHSILLGGAELEHQLFFFFLIVVRELSIMTQAGLELKIPLFLSIPSAVISGMLHQFTFLEFVQNINKTINFLKGFLLPPTPSPALTSPDLVSDSLLQKIHLLSHLRDVVGSKNILWVLCKQSLETICFKTHFGCVLKNELILKIWKQELLIKKLLH